MSKLFLLFVALVAVGVNASILGSELNMDSAISELDNIEVDDLKDWEYNVAFPVNEGAGNCTISQVHVNIVMRSRDFQPQFFDMKSVAERINPDSLEWVKIRDVAFAPMDAMVERRVLGAVGGDAGEFLLALKVFEELTGYKLRQRHVTAYLKAFLEKTAKGEFVASTTVQAQENLRQAVGVPTLDVLNPPVTLVRSLWDQIILPENVGCKHLRYLLERPEEYGVRLELTQMLVRAVYVLVWNKEHPQFTTAASKIRMELTASTDGKASAPAAAAPAASAPAAQASSETALNLLQVEAAPTKKEVAPRGLVNIMTGPHCLSEGVAPTIAPLTSDAVYVNHYDAVQVLRRDLARFFTLLVRDHFSALNEVAMLSRMNIVGRHHLQKTVKYVTVEIPIYSVTFI